MHLIYSSNEVKSAENAAIAKGDRSISMISRAARALLDYIYEQKDIDCSSVLILAGRGNNGADGILLGKMLLENGSAVAFYRLSGERFSQENLYFSENVSFLSALPEDLSTFTLIVDALYGIGFHGELKADEAQIIKRINDGGVPVLSVDIPSGVSADDGTFQTAIAATHTCALNCYKPGHFIYPGAACCGKTVLLDTDIPINDKATITALTTDDLKALPVRPTRSNKGTFGRVAVVAGSYGMAGAAYFAAKAALLSGAGLVEIYTPEENRVILQTLLPEAVLRIYTAETDPVDLLSDLSRCSSLVIGPGLGQSSYAARLIKVILNTLTIPAVVDADGLNLCCGSALLRGYKGPLVITPHPAEASRLLDCSTNEVTGKILDGAGRLSKTYQCTALLKDAHTVIASDEGVYLNLSGNNGMATGGCGDVLSGIIGALLAIGLPCLDAAAFGAFIHGLAGDEASKKHGKRSVTASRVLDNIEEILKDLD
ncbi:MAG: NAD(P)H-hydrate dehydratase [Clostridia bacterium]|nr:NAD(P)H-hydrate dehydratase [Clostridia bacterium]